MRKKSQAFTRVELLAVMVVLCLLGALALPLFGTTRQDSDRAGCASNLREMGRAMLLWAGDHGERIPWWTPTTEGGTRVNPKAGNAWFEWATLTNELAAARVLACPADTGVRVATGFDSSSTGFFNTGMRANALSYVVSLHAMLEYPKGLLSADRNLRFDSPSGVTGCSAGVNNAYAISSPLSAAGWTNAVHGPLGQALVVDGHVETTSSEDLKAVMFRVEGADQFGSEHFLRAR